MRFNRIFSVIGVAALALAMLAAGPARAADVELNYNDDVCDFAAAGLGKGSASDPFIIQSAKGLQEMQDCSNRSDSNNRSKAISSVTVNGDGTVTFVVTNTHGAYGVGQVVNISGTDGATFDASGVKVISSTDTVVVVKSSVSSGTTTTGTIYSNYDYYRLGADINLASAQNNDWNDLRSATITAGSASNRTVTFTATNNFTGGQKVFINGMGDRAFNLGHVTVDTASSTSFTVAEVSVANGSASSALGKADAPGWSPVVSLKNFDLNGAGRTISGLTIHSSVSNLGLIGYAQNGNIHNLNLTSVNVNGTANSYGDSQPYVGALVGETSQSNTSNINVSGDVIGSWRFVGMVIGRSGYGNNEYLTTSGTVSAGLINVASNTDGDYPPSGGWESATGGFGGVIGNVYAGSIAYLTSSVDVNGFAASQDGGTNTIYFHSVGGAVGYADEVSARNVEASGDVVGGSGVGGAIGLMYRDGEITRSSATGSVTAISNSYWPIQFVGGFSGMLQGDADASYITSTGAVSATATSDSTGGIANVGGLSGYINCCGATTNVETSSDVTVQHNGISGDVNGIGGLYGRDDCCNAVADGHATGDVTITMAGSGDASGVGGFVGTYDCCGTYRDSSATGNVSVTVDWFDGGVAYRVGGFMGDNRGSSVVTGSYSTGNVTVNNGYSVGGFVGETEENTSYRDSYATGNVTVSYDGNAHVGGFLGYADNGSGRINLERVSATGNVTVSPVTSGQAAYRVGGLVGYLDDVGAAIITDSYYKGSVTASDEVAGFIGGKNAERTIVAKRNYVAATVTATASSPLSVDPVAIGNWVDGNRTSFVNSTLAGTSVNFPEFNAASTSNMKLAATYQAKGWVFSGNSSGWRIASTENGGYPYLVDTSITNPIGTSESVSTEMVYKTLKSIKFKRNSTTLTKAHKKALSSVAKTIAKSDYSLILLQARPSSNKVAIAAQRQRNIYIYLAKELSKLKSTKSIRLTSKIKSKSKATDVIKVRGGK